MKVSKRKVLVHGRLRWQVDFGIVSGKRPRKVFNTESAADAHIDELERKQKKIGDSWIRSPRKDLEELIVFRETLVKEDVTLQEVWDGFRELRKLRAEKAVQQSVTFREAVLEWRREKFAVGKDERYLHDSAAL